jgi:hypothetical protein
LSAMLAPPQHTAYNVIHNHNNLCSVAKFSSAHS